MESRGYRHGSESQDSDDPVPLGTGFQDFQLMDSPSTSIPSPATSSASSRGVGSAKNRLRAFYIQKKAPVPPVTVVKPVSTGNATVLIGKLCSAKVATKPDRTPEDDKKLPKPPKPGGSKKAFNESYTELQKKTLSEIEDMKRKMEMVELGIPLGLVCPSTNALPVKAMPTKAMPPIKTFLDNAKIDEIIREARRAKAEGKEFKFDYQKFVPDYDNPFQRKSKDHSDQQGDETKTEVVEKKEDDHKKIKMDRERFIEKRRGERDRYDKRHAYKKGDRYRDRHREKDKRERNRSKDMDGKSRDRDHKSRDRDDKHKKDDKSDKKEVKVDAPKAKDDKSKADKKETPKKTTDKHTDKQDKDGKETDVNLKDFLVCDSWSLDNEGKNSPQVDDKMKKLKEIKAKIEDAAFAIDPLEQLRQSLGKGKLASPKPKIEKLKPVVDAFEFEIDPNDDEILDIFDEDSNSQKSAGEKSKKDSLYDSPVHIKYDKKESSNDGMNDENFLESVINEIKQEHMYDDESHDKGLVEYDESPARDSKEPSIGSVTPDMDDNLRAQSQRSDYSDSSKSIDSRKSIESGYKSTESGYKSESKIVTQKTDSKFTSSTFKPIEPAKSNRFKATFKPAEKSANRSRSSESHSNSEKGKPENRSKSSEGTQKSKTHVEDRDEFSVERELDEALEAKMTKDTVHSLETWSFVLKICQPLLFRHDKNKCYKETRTTPKLWYTLNPKLCNCVTDRSIVYEELERCKKDLVDRLYSCDQIREPAQVIARTWYPKQEQCLIENPTPMQLSSEWDLDDDQTKDGRLTTAPEREGESLDLEYQRFMEAVSWPETSPPQPSDSRSLTPTRGGRKAKTAADSEERKDAKKMKLSSEGWSQESEVEEEKTKKPEKKKSKEKRKRKRSDSTISSDSDEVQKKKKKSNKKKEDKKAKTKAKRKRLEKKVLKKLQEKKKKKKTEKEEDSDTEQVEEKETKKKDKKVKKKKQQKVKKKTEKKKKRAKSSSSSSSSSSDSSSDSEEVTEKKTKKKKKEVEAKKKKKKEKKKKRKQSSSESQSDDQNQNLFDVNILNNIKTERLTDDEKKTKHREIINVKELQDDFSSNIQIKQEVEELSKASQVQQVQPTEQLPEHTEPPKEVKVTEEVKEKEPEVEKKIEESPKKVVEVPKKVVEVPKKVKEVKEVTDKVEKDSKHVEVKPVDCTSDLMNTFDIDAAYSSNVEEKIEKVVFKEPLLPSPPVRGDDTSQCSSQESIQSITSVHEKDDSHLRPSCDNSNYSFNDVINSQSVYKNLEDKFEGYENYEMYEQMAMAYQSDVASQQISPPSSLGEQRIETVVRARSRGEIKCDWRAGDGPAPDGTQQSRPSRWGLKPGEVNIVLTGGGCSADPRLSSNKVAPSPAPAPAPAPRAAHPPAAPVYRIQSLANRADNSVDYDEAYMDMYGASDRLQYGDCFAAAPSASKTSGRAEPPAPSPKTRRSLDDRISQALQGSVLEEVAKDENGDKDKGILQTKPRRANKRVSFADGYTPGQDSDVEEPPIKKRKKPRRTGCAWPCPATHPDHVPLWDALPPPPPPPGSPPPPAALAPPVSLLREQQYKRGPHMIAPTHEHHKFSPNVSIPNFMPPEPPPGLITFP